MMKILFAASEAVPFMVDSHATGLRPVFDKERHDVRVIMRNTRA